VIVTAARTVLDLIGNTPVVDVSPLSPNPDARLWVKLEGQNPGGSVKDRIARAMIEQAEADGELWPGRRIIEPSSGNTGIGLALIAKLRGYPITIVMPDNTTAERRQLLELFGAEIISTPGAEGSNGAVRRAQQLADDHPDWAFLYQYGNEANPQAHYDGTGPEILADVPGVTHFVTGLGTSGTLLGVGTYLKEQKPDVKVFAVEPPAGEKVEGLRSLDDGYVPPVFEKWGGADLLDGKRIVRPRESVLWTRRLASECGIFAGVSTGAALAGAVKVAERLPDGERAEIVIISADGGWKYLSTGIYTASLDDAAHIAETVSTW
jgi:[CysO sulfur-carrier protein]-thiocarboxylate-dependent cysteine synthase